MQRADWGVALGAALIALLLWGLRHQLPLLERVDRWTLDAQMQARGPLAPGQAPPVVLVAIDDRSLQALGGATPHRAQYATLIERLQQAGAGVAALDVLMVEASRGQPAYDELLAERLAAGRPEGSGGLVVGLPFALPGQPTPGALTDAAPPLPLLQQALGKVFASPELIAAMPIHPQGLVAPLPLLAEAAPLLGHVTAERGVDGALRYDLPLLLWQDEWFPSMALRLAGFALGERDWSQAEARLGEGLRWGRLWLPLDASSRQWINYYGPAGSFPTFSFIDVLEGRVPAARLKGAVVIVGATALGSGDTFPTPFDSGLPGMERLATVVDNLITGRVLQRGSPLAEIVAMLLLPLAAVWLLARLSARQAATALLLLLLSGLLAAQMRFQYGLHFHSLAFPLLALVGAVFGGALLRARRERSSKEAAVQALRISEERYALAARGASDGLWDWERGSGALHLSERWWALMGLEPRPAGMEAFGLPLDAKGRAGFELALQEHLEGRSQQLHHLLQFRQGGQDRALLVRGMASRDAGGQALRVAGSLTDLSETQNLQRQLSHDALHDRLTGLANRALFLEHLQQLIKEPLGVVLIGIDGFRAFNEAEGMALGDALLRELGRRLSQRASASTVLRPTVARLGADQFGLAFVAPLDLGDQDAARTPSTLLTLVTDPMQVAGRELRIQATLGWAHTSQGLSSAEELLAAAEMALALAKDGTQRGGLRAYDPADQLLQNSRRWLKDNIDAALRDGSQFQMYYQPLVRLADRQLLGFEALIRWQHPERGFIMPGDFIPYAEESGQIVPMGAWTLRQVARQLNDWHALGFEGEIAVNLSSRQFVEGDLEADARAALALLSEGIDAKRIKLEVTESMAMANPHETAALLQGLHAMGFKISIDDFGTGYSSLAYLHQFPFDTLKIDRSFVMRLHQGRDAQEIVRTIVGLTQALGKQALAEGVEEERQAQLLHELGVQIGQGWLFGKAVPAEQARAMFAAAVATDLEV